MAATSRLPKVLGADGIDQQLQPTDVLFLGGFPVANLPPASAGLKQGSLAFATNGRAIVGVSVLGIAGLLFQTAGNGTGCLVTWSGSAWQVAGTASTVQA